MAPVLVAGIGNVFFGDDGFGVAVAAALRRESLPNVVEVVDFGIRGIHLAYELLVPRQLLIVVDAVQRGGAPGTVYVLDADLGSPSPSDAPKGAHGMHLPSVLYVLSALGGTCPRVVLVGCEPGNLDEGIGLSPPVEQAVREATRVVRDLLASTASGCEPLGPHSVRGGTDEENLR